MINIQLPNISQSDLSNAEGIKKVLEALYQVNEQLRFVLNNIGVENLSPELQKTIESAGNTDTITQRVADLEGDAYTFFEQTEQTFALVVYKNGVISSINLSPEAAVIRADKIALEGYVSINNTFTVDTSGFMRASGGTIGGWTIGPRYLLSMYGNMEFDSFTGAIAGGSITGTTLNGVSIKGGSLETVGGSLSSPMMDSGGVYSALFSAPAGGDYTRLTNGMFSVMVSSGDMGFPITMDGALGVSGIVSCAEVITGSDSRLKKDIESISDEDAAALIFGLRPVKFKYRTGDSRVHNGFLAQEAPEEMRRIGPDGYFSLAYNEVIAPLVKTVQMQERRIKQLEDNMAALKAEPEVE